MTSYGSVSLTTNPAALGVTGGYTPAAGNLIASGVILNQGTGGTGSTVPTSGITWPRTR